MKRLGYIAVRKLRESLAEWEESDIKLMMKMLIDSHESYRQEAERNRSYYEHVKRQRQRR